MRMAQGIEWAVHACTLLAPLGSNRGFSLAALAEFHGVAPPYMAKQMQLLSRAGLVRTSRGASGGYALAKPPDQITLHEIVRAIEGPAPVFRCTEIRQRGPCAQRRVDCRKPCGIAAAFAAAESAWRDHLEAVTVADMLAEAANISSHNAKSAIIEWVEANVTVLPDRQAAESRPSSL